MILADNGYQEVSPPAPGDLIVYRERRGQVDHTAVVRFVGDLVLVEGKWNCLGRYVHRPEQYPYGQTFAYYRSARRGHLLQLPGE